MLDSIIRLGSTTDHTMFREGLARILSSYGGMEVIWETTNDDAAAELAREERPDVVVMQVQMPSERARESLRRMRELSPPPRVVIVTMFQDPGYVRELTSLGASAYVVKSASVDYLLGAFRAAIFDPKGENVVVGMPRAMLEEAQGGAEEVPPARELEILLLVSRGMSNRQIASALQIEETMVKRHLATPTIRWGLAPGGKQPGRRSTRNG